MKYILSFFIFLSSWSALAQETFLTGVFKGYSIYIQNSYNKDFAEFCINEVIVNEKRINLNLKLSALKINFKDINLFTPVSIKIIHKNYCNPKIVNPEAILYHSSFKFDSLFLNDSLLTWYTRGDRQEGIYKIERLEDGFWKVQSKLKSKGYFEGAKYIFFTNHKSGGNIYRIKYELPNSRFLYSQDIEFFKFPDKITFFLSDDNNEIILSEKAPYIITNKYDREIMRGNAKIIPIGRLKAGKYFIEIDENMETFTKR